MAQSYNLVTIVGRLTKDPEQRQTSTGKNVCSFSLAVDKRGKDAGTNFFDCEAWGTTAEFISKYVKKGALLLVSGRLDQQCWEKDGQRRYAIRVVADEAVSLGGNKTPQDSVPTPQELSHIEEQQVNLNNIPF